MRLSKHLSLFYSDYVRLFNVVLNTVHNPEVWTKGFIVKLFKKKEAWRIQIIIEESLFYVVWVSYSRLLLIRTYK